MDGNADKEYVFEVPLYDQYNNLPETFQEVVGIKIDYKKINEITNSTSATNTTTGYRKYNVLAHKTGEYIISSDKNNSQGLY